MGYTIRDVDKALKDIIDSRNLTVVMEGKEVRVRSNFSSPDEMIAKFRLPMICIESGYMIRTPENWQPDLSRGFENNGNYVGVTTCRLIDIFYSYKVGFYVSLKPHCTLLEIEFLKMFPNKFYADVVDYSGNEYTVSFVSNEALVNIDEVKSTYNKDRPLNEAQIDSDTRIYRRDKIVTAQLTMEESSVESLLRPYAGIQFNVAMNSVVTVSTIATVSPATITFVED